MICKGCDEDKPTRAFKPINGRRVLNSYCDSCVNQRSIAQRNYQARVTPLSVIQRRLVPHVVQTRIVTDKDFLPRVYARLPDGSFVHQSGNGSTTDRNYAWHGRHSQIDALCAQFEIDRETLRIED